MLFLGPRKNLVILLAIITGAIALRLYCFRGFAGLDDAEYARFAHQIFQSSFTPGTYDGPAVFPLRVGIIFPTSLLFRFFGVSEWSMVFYPFFLSIMNIFLAYICTKHFFGNRAGLIAAALWTVLPIEVANATSLVPDLPAAFYGSLAVTCVFFLVASRTEHKLPLLSGGGLAGLSFGLSWLCKETVVYLLPFCLILLFITTKHNLKKNALLWTGVAAGSIVVLLTEMLTYHNLIADSLFRFHEIERNYLQYQDGFFSEGSRWGWSEDGSYAFALLKRLLLTGPIKILFNYSYFLFLPFLGLIASFYAFYWKDKAFFIPALWLITLVFMFNFSSSSFSSYRPIALFERYMYPILFPAILLTAGFTEKLLFYHGDNRSIDIHRERYFWGIVLSAALVLVGGYQAFRNIRGIGPTNAWTAEVQTVSNLLTSEERIYTDFISKRGLEFFWRYPEKMKVINFEGMKSPEGIPAGSFVLTNRWYADWLDINAGMWLSDSLGYKKPPFFDQPPPSWKIIWRNANATLYSVE